MLGAENGLTVSGTQVVKAFRQSAEHSWVPLSQVEPYRLSKAYGA